MEKVIIIRYAEIHLKRKNRGYFERIFATNLERSLKGIRHELHRTSGRWLVEGFPEELAGEAAERVLKVFGVHSVSEGYLVGSELGEIYEGVKLVAPTSGSFKVETHRGYKQYPMNSMEISAAIGGRLLSDRPQLRVDVHEPENTVYIDVRQSGSVLVFGSFLRGVGGMPVGSAGKGLLMISGGIDSPVAGYMMAKRGLTVELLHFHSYPYTNEGAKEKVVTLAKELSVYTGVRTLCTVSVTEIQEEIHRKCAAELNVTLLRRFMFRIAERIAKEKALSCLITGESLGQVASQTMEGLISSGSVITMPVLRPLIGFDKDEIIERAKTIGTYSTSVLPYEDCCTVFLPEHPATRPKLDFIEREEGKLDVEKLVEDALRTIETLQF